jgi:hypothetical protein
MKFFIDTANLSEIREANDLGILDGVTTNPSLMAKEGITGANNILKHYVDICNIVDGPVSAEVIATDFEGMIREGEQLAELHKNIVVKIPMIPEGIKAIEEQGKYIKDWEGDYSTTTINEKECAYAIYDKKGILQCGIEQAYNDGIIDFKKPISCHLYPIRITKYESYHAINYDRWSICSDACALGDKLGVEVYKFLKEPLIRAYGEAWYKQLVQEIEDANI